MKETKTNTILKRIFASALALAVIFVSTVATSEIAYARVKEPIAVHINHHQVKSTVYLTDGNVADVLTKAGITLSPSDTINTATDTQVYDGMSIQIDEVKHITDVKKQKIAFETKVKETDEHPVGYEKVIQNGTHGIKEVITTHRQVNREKVAVVKRSENIIKEPQEKVVLKGTAQIAPAANFNVAKKPVQSTSNSKNTINGLSYSKVLTGSATAYTASEGALTATGVPAYVGGVAVNPNIIPYGSKLYIVADGYTYGYATAVDTGGALMSGTALVDLYMSTYDECINFGRRNVTVYVLS